MTQSNSRDHIFALVSAERARQEEKFPGQKLPLRGAEGLHQAQKDASRLVQICQASCEALTKDGRLHWIAVLEEEVMEAICEMLADRPDLDRVRAELVQVMAVCSRILEQIGPALGLPLNASAACQRDAPDDHSDHRRLVVRFPAMLKQIGTALGLPHNGRAVVGCVLDGSTFMVDEVDGRFRAAVDVGGKKVEAFGKSVFDAIRACQRDAADPDAPAAPAPDPLVEEKVDAPAPATFEAVLGHHQYSVNVPLRGPLVISGVTCGADEDGAVFYAQVNTTGIEAVGKNWSDAAERLIIETAKRVNRPMREVARAYLEVALASSSRAPWWPYLREAAQEGVSAAPTVEVSEEASIPWARVYTDKIVARLGGGAAQSIGEAVTRICDAHEELEDRLNCVENTLRHALAGLLGEDAVHSPSSGFPLPIDKLADLAALHLCASAATKAT